MTPHSSIGFIILAAGNSSRLGRPKQLLSFNGKSLLRIVYDAATVVAGQHIIVVTGAYHSEITEELEDVPVHFVHHTEWEKGLGSSIKAGLGKLIETYPDVTHAFIAVSDQPFVSATLFSDMLAKASDHQGAIIACAYDDTLGTPVLFPEKYFPVIFSNEDSHGAKKILSSFKDDIVAISFPKGGIDIDTQKDYQQLVDE